MARRRTRDGPLSDAEWRVVELVRDGRANAEIAIRLGISVAVVEQRVESALARLRLPDRRALQSWTPEAPSRRERPWRRLGLAVAALAVAAAAIGLLTTGGGDGTTSDTPEDVDAGSLLLGYANRTDTPEPRAGHTATELPDGSVLVVGGFEPRAGGSVRPVEAYDPAAGDYALVSLRGILRRGHTATLLRDGTVLAAGGGEGDLLGSAELYDVAAGVVIRAGDMLHPRKDHAAALLRDGRVLIVGGFRTGRDTLPAELYDPIAQAFRDTAAPIHTRLAGHTLTTLQDGRVLVVGGRDLEGFTPEAELYDPRSDAFEPAGALSQPRAGHTATLLPDGRVLIAGGSTGAGTTGSIEVWDPATRAFTTSGSLSEPRRGHTATLLADGSLLFVGGDGAGAAPSRELASAERYDPASGTNFLAPGLGVARSAHSASLLPSGDVLVLGGRGSGVPDRPAEVLAVEPGPVVALPSAPELVSVEAGDGSLRIRWEGPAERAELVTAYDVGVAPSSRTIELDAQAREAVLQDLRPAQYVVTVTARTATGNGVRSAAESVRVWTRPGPVVTVRVQAVRGGAQVRWERPRDEGGYVTHYTVSLDGGAQVREVAETHPDERPLFSSGNLSATFDGLTNGHTYAVSVTAHNPAGGGPAVTTFERGNFGALLNDPPDGTPLTVTPRASLLASGATARQAFTLHDGRVLMAGGPVLDAFDPEGEMLETIGELQMAYEGEAGEAVLLDDGRVAFVGGWDRSQQRGVPLGAVEVVDPATGESDVVAEITPARYAWTVTLLRDGRLFVAGGWEVPADPEASGIPHARTELVDLTTGRVSRGPDLMEPRHAHTATLLADGRVLLAGGRIPGVTPSSSSTESNSVEMYDPVSNTVAPLGELVTGRYSHRAVRLADGSVLLWDGVTDSSSVSVVERFDPATGVSRPMEELHVTAYMSGVLLADGRVLFAGSNPNVTDPPPGGFIWDPRTGRTQRFLLQSPRYLPALAPLADGRVVIAGGVIFFTNRTVEIFDPATGETRVAGE